MPTQVLICVGFFVIESFFEKIEKNFDKTIDKCEYLWYTIKSEVIYMSIEKAIANATASIEMEGFQINEQCKEWCRSLLQGEITMEEYIVLVKQRAGVDFYLKDIFSKAIYKE